MPPKTNALAVPTATLTHDDLQALLQQSGMLSAPTNFTRRMKLDGGTLVALDGSGEAEEQFPPRFNGKEPAPALTVRIVEPPVYYSAFWLDQDESRGGFDASRIGHPELNKSFAKRYDDPAQQQLDHSPANEFFEQIAAVAGTRGKFSADIKLQIVPESGEMTGDETVYTFAMSTTAVLDFRGTSKNPMGGVAQEKNFIVQLAELAMATAIEQGTDPRQAVLDAQIALRLGGVVADIYLLRQQNEDKSMTWTIPAFRPVHIELGTAAPQLAAEAPTGDVGF